MKVYFFKAKTVLTALILTFAALLCIIIFAGRNKEASDVFHPGLSAPSVIIDAGHGGIDGGAVSAAGAAEAPLNLAISQKVRDVMGFFGVSSIMTREDEASLGYDPDSTIRENKRADLNARLEISRNNPDCDFLSIHLNKYEQQKYRGAQVFYSPNNDKSIELASRVQEKMRVVLDKDNDRRAKLSPNSVFLMEQIKAPAITIECGFLSNPEEAELLASPDYQTKIAISIYCGYIDYLEKGGI